MKVLLSALACEPGKGSELEVGFRALLAAASRHDVWVLTNSASIPVVQRAIAAYPWADRVHLEGIYFEVDDELYPQLTVPGFHRYYDRWQRQAAVRAAELDRRVDFDVVHHVTLAAHWTRAGVTSVDKPLVWGPVGGGVEAPGSLLGELGWRGIAEEAGRVIARRVLARLGPARIAQRRAAVTFTQNQDTARVILHSQHLRVLPNATSVDLRDAAVAGSRRSDIVLVARLLPWKGGRLAVRALRHVQHPGAVLRVFGDGPDRGRILRAARRFGVAHRVQLEGRMQRDELLGVVGTAGVFLHPSFHDEAGLAVAEALSLGTPVVCLDRGGPSELLRYWPETPSAAVAPGSAEDTARALAAAIDRFLQSPPGVLADPRPAAISFTRELLSAYELAVADGQRARASMPVWGFPKGKPQVFAQTLHALSKGVPIYGFGRRLPRWVQRGLAVQVRVPLLRRLIAEQTDRPEPACGWELWRGILADVQRRHPEMRLQWIRFRSQWNKQRSSALGLGPDGTPRLFVVVDPESRDVHARVAATPSFHVATCHSSFCREGWQVRQYEPLPRFHRPAAYDLARLRRVADDVAIALEGVLPRPNGIPPHWRPIHGDFVPWNLREGDDGQLWLLDWEDASWGPPAADLIRYVVAYHSLGWSSPGRIAAIVRRTIPAASPDVLREVASFWLRHPNLRPVKNAGNWARLKMRDAARGAREFAAFEVLASATRDALPAREPAPVP